MAVFRLHDERAVRKLEAAGAYLRRQEALEIAGERVLDASLQAFRDQADPETHQGWPALKPATLKRRRKRRRKRGGGAQILIDRGILRGSIGRGRPRGVWRRKGADRLEVGTAVGYGVYHQSTRPRRRIERRAFLGVDQRLAEQIIREVRAAVDDQLVRN